MQLHQLSVNYVANQDRILIRLNTTAGDELRVWLTRRLSLKFWPALNGAVAEEVARHLGTSGRAESPMTHADEATRQLMADFDRHASLGKADFKTPFQTQANRLPLGQEPLLATEIRIEAPESGGLRFNIQEKLSGQASQRGFQAQMDAQTLHGFVHMLDQALTRSGWLAEGGATQARPAGTPVEEKPKYLN